MIIVFIFIMIGVIGSIVATCNLNKGTFSGSANADKAPDKIKQWEYQDSFDKMRNERTYFASMNSTNKLYFQWPYSGGSSGNIIFRKSPKFGKDVYLTIEKGQFHCGAHSCSISAKFDNNAIEKYSVVEAESGSADVLFIKNYDRFLQRTKSAKKLTIEASFYDEGIHQLEFDVSGLKWDY